MNLEQLDYLRATTSPKFEALILCAGKSTRFGGSQPKISVDVHGQTPVGYSETGLRNLDVNDISATVGGPHRDAVSDYLDDNHPHIRQIDVGVRANNNTIRSIDRARARSFRRYVDRANKLFLAAGLQPLDGPPFAPAKTREDVVKQGFVNETAPWLLCLAGDCLYPIQAIRLTQEAIIEEQILPYEANTPYLGRRPVIHLMLSNKKTPENVPDVSPFQKEGNLPEGCYRGASLEVDIGRCNSCTPFRTYRIGISVFDTVPYDLNLQKMRVWRKKDVKVSTSGFARYWHDMIYNVPLGRGRPLGIRSNMEFKDINTPEALEEVRSMDVDAFVNDRSKERDIRRFVDSVVVPRSRKLARRAA